MRRLPHARTIILIAGGLGLFGLAWYVRQHSLDSPQALPPEAPVSAPNTLACDQRIVDFGRDYRINRRVITHTFSIRNNAGEPVNLEVGGHSCMCTTAELTPKSVPPGETALLRVVWQVPCRIGRNDFSVMVKSTSGNDHLILGGRIFLIDVVRMSPEEIDFGNLRPGETKAQRVVFAASPGEPLPTGLSLPSTADPATAIGFTIVKRTTSMIEADLTIECRPGAGKQEHTIPIQTGEPAQKEILLKVVANHFDHVYAEPNSVLFASADELEKGKWVTIKTANKQAVEIAEVVLDRPGLISAKHRNTDANQLEVCLFSAPGLKPTGNTSGTVQVKLRNHEKPISIRYLVLGE